MVQNEQQTYENKICAYCKHKDTCPKDKVIINRVSDKTSSILCYSYEYEKL